MKPYPSTQVTTSEALLAYYAAALCLHITPDIDVLKGMAEITHTTADLLDAVRAMRDAKPYDRVLAAIDLLHKRGKK